MVNLTQRGIVGKDRLGAADQAECRHEVAGIQQSGHLRNGLLSHPADTGVVLVLSYAQEPEQQEHRRNRNGESGLAGESRRDASDPCLASHFLERRARLVQCCSSRRFASFSRHCRNRSANLRGRSAGSACQSGSCSSTAAMVSRQRLALERALSGEQLVQEASEGPDVRPLIDLHALAPAPDSCTRECPRSAPPTVPEPVSVAGSERCGFASVPQIAFARPKSNTLTLPCGVTLTLAGFRSRWMIPCSCAASSASATWQADRAR